MTVGQASDSMTGLTLSFNPIVGAWYLSLAGPTVVQLEGFCSLGCLWVIGPFLCFVIVCLSAVMMNCIIVGEPRQKQC